MKMIKIESKTHKKIKIEAAKSGKSMMKVVDEAINLLAEQERGNG